MATVACSRAVRAIFQRQNIFIAKQKKNKSCSSVIHICMIWIVIKPLTRCSIYMLYLPWYRSINRCSRVDEYCFGRTSTPVSIKHTHHDHCTWKPCTFITIIFITLKIKCKQQQFQFKKEAPWILHNLLAQTLQQQRRYITSRAPQCIGMQPFSNSSRFWLYLAPIKKLYDDK